jgi:hypothetical protein
MNQRSVLYAAFTQLIFAFILIVSARTATATPEELEPDAGLYASYNAPEPYDLALRALLIGQHPHRQCQILAVPSFEREWAVYMIREDKSPPTLIFNRMQKHLWAEMQQKAGSIGKNDGKNKSLTSHEIDQKAIESMGIQVDTVSAPLKSKTADLLEDVWWRMLTRVRYPPKTESGLDGVRYHVSHKKQYEAYRSGQTQSPEEGTRPAALIALAQQMKAFAEKPSEEGEERLQTAARALLKRIEEETKTSPR